MLAMSNAQIFMQHYTVAYREAPIHAIHEEEYQPGNVVRTDNKRADDKQQYKSNTNTTNIAGKALCLSLRTEIKQAKYEHTKNNNFQ
jgi:hypothetical protein